MHDALPPSPWVLRWSRLIRPGGEVLDVACGSGRHVRWLAQQGFRVTGVDRDAHALASLQGIADSFVASLPRPKAALSSPNASL